MITGPFDKRKTMDRPTEALFLGLPLDGHYFHYSCLHTLLLLVPTSRPNKYVPNKRYATTREMYPTLPLSFPAL